MMTQEEQETINRANTFFNDVLPQMGNIVIQDYENLNTLGILLTKYTSTTTTENT